MFLLPAQAWESVNDVLVVVAISCPFRSMRNRMPSLRALSCQLRLTFVASTVCTISAVGALTCLLVRYAAPGVAPSWLLAVSQAGPPIRAGTRKPVTAAMPATAAEVTARTARRRFLAFLASLRPVRV
jgi:hypothetical protein